MQIQNFIPGIRVLARPKLAGGGEHFGVELWDHSVLHLTINGCEHVRYEEFAQGLCVRPIYTAPAQDTVEIMQRVQQALVRPQEYRFLAWNCEHFANWVVGRPAESSQVNRALITGMALAALRMLAK